MPRFLVWFVTLAVGLFGPARSAFPQAQLARVQSAGPPSAFEQAVEELQQRYQRGVIDEAPRVQIESLTLLAALSMVRILEVEGRYEPFESAMRKGESAVRNGESAARSGMSAVRSGVSAARDADRSVARDAEDERWLYAGERVARVRTEEFPEYFELERCQRELGLWVGADDAELDQRLTGWRVPRELANGAERLVERARRMG